MQTEISSGPAFAFGEIKLAPGSSVRVEAGAMAGTVERVGRAGMRTSSPDRATRKPSRCSSTCSKGMSLHMGKPGASIKIRVFNKLQDRVIVSACPLVKP